MSSFYLRRINGWYYFRIWIPRDLQQWFKGKELKRSLRTKNPRSARSLAKVWLYKTEKIFTHIRSGLLTDEQIRELVKNYVKETLSEIEENKAVDFGVAKNSDDLDEKLETHELLLSDYREYLAYNDLKQVENTVDSILEESAIGLDKDSTQYKKLCREILKGIIQLMEVVTSPR